MSKRSNADKRRAQRKKKPSPPPRRDFQSFLKDSAGPVVHSVMGAYRRGESVLDAWLGAMTSEVHRAIARDAFEWVHAERGRKVVLGWDGEFVRLQYLDADGKEVMK